jgi:hypothetical protein
MLEKKSAKRKRSWARILFMYARMPLTKGAQHKPAKHMAPIRTMNIKGTINILAIIAMGITILK